MPAKPLDFRCGLHRLLNLISAVVLLYQFQREVPDDCFPAADEDYRINRDLYVLPFRSLLLRGLETACQKTLEVLTDNFGSGRPFTPQQAATAVGKDRSNVSRHLRQLVGAGLVEKSSPAEGKLAAKYCVPEDPMARLLLPTLDARPHN